MKSVIFLLLPFFIFGCSSGSNEMTPIEYNDAIVNEQNKIIAHILEMSNSAFDITIAEAHRMKIIEQCDVSIALVEAMDAYDGNSDLRDAALNLFKFYREIASAEFREMLELLDKEEVGDAEYDALNLIDQQIAQREAPLDAAFQKAQLQFSEKYNLMLQKNQFQDAIDGR
jgi:hypothetical protein